MFASEHLADACERTGDLGAALKHHRRFHALFRQVTSGSRATQRPRGAVRLETQHAHDSAVRHRTMAEDLQRSNEQLARRADDLLQLSCRIAHGLGQPSADGDAGRGRRQRHALVMIDVDRFKTINDGWSHLVGDAVLRQIAVLIRGCAAVRPTRRSATAATSSRSSCAVRTPRRPR